MTDCSPPSLQLVTLLQLRGPASVRQGLVFVRRGDAGGRQSPSAIRPSRPLAGRAVAPDSGRHKTQSRHDRHHHLVPKGERVRRAQSLSYDNTGPAWCSWASLSGSERAPDRCRSERGVAGICDEATPSHPEACLPRAPGPRILLHQNDGRGSRSISPARFPVSVW